MLKGLSPEKQARLVKAMREVQEIYARLAPADRTEGAAQNKRTCEKPACLWQS
jgi:hypothetical protein